mmetsp:Transcript_21499/g.27698  ORF Transcript_21499/g.27698 Transcript_21499/m.27698 type:complete len:203 (+) Transcript_21499:131-739(+)
MNNVANIQKINASELEKGLYYVGGDQSQSSSWHAKYHDSAWVYIGGLSNRLTEGDVVCIMSEYGELEDINLVRDEDTGASRGFAFVKYEDSRSCVLAVDNFTGSQLLGRTLRCDHVDNYRLPKELREREERWEAGHAYKDKELASAYNINSGQDLFAGTETTRKGESEYKLIPEFDDDDDDDASNGSAGRWIKKEDDPIDCV